MDEEESEASGDSGVLSDEDGADEEVVMVERNALINGFVRIRTGISSTMFEKVSWCSTRLQISKCINISFPIVRYRGIHPLALKFPAL